ncbi:MAG: hypothetical protein ABSF29_01145 [Tepidisphaeraceae bacterium]|jgi:tetratricopeptide (TPR) repeat protein
MIRCKSRILACLAAALVTGLYAAAAWHNAFVYDDHEVIENQFPLHSWQDLSEIFREPHYLNFPYYRPITRSTFAIQRAISGNNPRPYHLFNALLAGLATLAAYGLLRQRIFALTPPAALLAALWFSLHPAMSECVYPAASGRETLLANLLMLLSTWAYLHPSIPSPRYPGERARVRGSTPNSPSSPPHPTDAWKGAATYSLAMFFFAAALLAKEQAAVLPAIFILADLLLQKPRSHRLLRYLPPFILLAGYFLLRHLIFQSPTLNWDIQNHPFAPLLSLLYGLQTAIAPFTTLHYEPPLHVWLDPPLTTTCLIVLTLLCVWIARSKSPIPRIALFWLGWFILMQLPTAHIFRQEAPYSERYVALALLAVAGSGAMLIQNLKRPLARYSAAAVAVLWIAGLGFVSVLRASSYTDDTSFALQWLNTNPESAGAHNGLGLVAQSEHKPSVAIDQYTQALELDPDSKTAHNNLANLLADRNDYAAAAVHYRWLLTQNAEDVSALVNYAHMLGQQAYAQHNPALRDQAHAILIDAINLRPNYAQAHYILAIWNETFSTRDSAIAEFQKALALRPDLPGARDRLNALLSLTSRP